MNEFFAHVNDPAALLLGLLGITLLLGAVMAGRRHVQPPRSHEGRREKGE